jgi:hypothetical protein
MSDKPKSSPNWSLLMPVLLLLTECIAILVMRLMGYTITHNLLYFFIALGIFLIYRIGKYLIASWRVRNAIRQLNSVDKLIESGQPMEAIRQWKKLLLSLPQDKYLEVLSRMEKVYEQEEMPKAALEVKMVHSESIEFFEALSETNKNKLINRQDWQSRAIALRNMIRALPEEKD